MCLPWLKHYFLLCLIVPVYSLSGPCNRTLYRALRYCGDGVTFGLYKHGEHMYYRLQGRYCYADSKRERNHVHRTMWDAQKQCKRDGAQLPEFYQKSDWDDLIATKYRSYYDFGDWYYLGAQYREKERKWYWLGTGQEVGFTDWESGQPDRLYYERCLFFRKRKWHNVNCTEHRPFLCQKIGKEAYERQSYLTASLPGKDESTSYKYGDIVTIKCLAVTEYDFTIAIKTPYFGAYDIDGTAKSISEIFFYDIKYRQYYRFEEQRCFRYNELSMKVNFSERIHEAEMTCTRKNPGSNKRVLSFSSSMQLKLLPYLKIECLNISKETMAGEHLIPECSTFTVHCSGFGFKKDYLTFQIVDQENQNKYSWTFGSNSSLPSWVVFKGLEEFYDKVHGVSYKIITSVTVYVDRPKLSVACMEQDQVSIDVLNLNIVANKLLPPLLTSKRHDEASAHILTLYCEATIGSGDSHSWTIELLNGPNNTVRVGRDGQVTGITFPWISVELAILDSTCGHPIHSTLKVGKNIPPNKTITFSCYSYDVSKRRKFNIQSDYTTRELSASITYPEPEEYYDYDYDKGEGEGEKEGGDRIILEAAETVLYSIWFVAIVTALLGTTIFYAVWAHRRQQKKEMVYDLAPDLTSYRPVKKPALMGRKEQFEPIQIFPGAEASTVVSGSQKTQTSSTGTGSVDPVSSHRTHSIKSGAV